MSGRPFLYGDPATNSSVLGPRPPCWGTSKYDNEDRECRNCGFQNTCREQTIKTKTAVVPTVAVPTAVPTPSNYFSQFQPATAYAAPRPLPAVQARPIVPPSPVPVQPAVPIHQTVPIQAVAQHQQMPPMIQDRYGQFQDPMFVTIKATPGIMRPQLPGESFPERVMKNMALASLESAIGEVLLGVRQFLWVSPREEDKEKK